VLDVDDLIVYEVRFWVVLVLAFLTAIPGQRMRRPPEALAMWFVVFVGWFLASAIWAPSRAHAVDKGLELAVLALGTLAILRLARAVPPGALLGSLWPILGCLLAVFAVLGLAIGSEGGARVAVLGGGPNVFGRNMGLLALVCVAAALGSRRRGALVVAAIVAGALVLLSGSRGALVATLAGLAVLLFVRRVRVSRAIVVLAMLVVVAIGVALYTDLGHEAMAAFEQRVMVLTFEQDHDSGRAGIYRDALAMGLRAPIVGAGLGAFAAEGHGIYPHNIFLEAFAEGGVVGLVLLLTVLGRAAIATLRREVRALDGAAFVLLLTASQFSGDFYDSRGVFVLALLIAGRRR
jgi:O-antigen ligase